MKTIFSLIVACIVVSSGAYPQGTAENTQLEDFAAFAEDEQLQVNEWTVTMKEPLNQTNIDEVKKTSHSCFKNRSQRKTRSMPRR